MLTVEPGTPGPLFTENTRLLSFIDVACKKFELYKFDTYNGLKYSYF